MFRKIASQSVILAITPVLVSACQPKPVVTPAPSITFAAPQPTAIHPSPTPVMPLAFVSTSAFLFPGHLHHVPEFCRRFYWRILTYFVAPDYGCKRKQPASIQLG
jgi:hypothetical protein